MAWPSTDSRFDLDSLQSAFVADFRTDCVLGRAKWPRNLDAFRSGEGRAL